MSSNQQQRAGAPTAATTLAPQRWEAGDWWAVTLVLIQALLLRLAFWWLQGQSGAVPPADPEEYYRAALHIMQGGYHDTGKWLRPPLYPAFLALLFFATGTNVSLALLGQALLSSLGVLAIMVLSRWLFERFNVALLSGVIAALFIPLASFSSVLFAEALFIALIILALALLVRVLVTANRRVALLCGVLLGLATLTRATALLFIPISALLVLLTTTIAAEPPSVPATRQPAHVTRRQRIVLSGLLLLGAVVIIAPWTIRNYLVHERLILVDTNGGISMWYGTVQGEDDRLAGEARLAAIDNLADRQTLAVQMTFERIAENPWLFIIRMRYKVASLFTLQLRNFATGELVTISPRDELVVVGAGENPLSLTWIADTQYVLIMLTGIIGLCFTPSWRRALPVALWVAFSVLLSAVTVAHPRLRLPIVVALIPFSAYALLQLTLVRGRLWRLLRDRRTILALAGCLVFLGLIFSMRYLNWMAGERYATPARRALANGDTTTALALFEQARLADPTNALHWISLADTTLAQSNIAGALALYEQATAQEDRNLYAHAMRIQTATLLSDAETAWDALATIDRYGRDNNDIYRWAWHTARTAPPPQVVPGNPLALGHYEGFAPATFDLPQGRWTLGQGRVRLRGSCGTLRLRLFGPIGREVEIWIADQPLRERVLMNNEPQTLELPLDGIAECAIAPPLVVHLRSRTALLDLERAPWMVGVALIEAVVD